MECNIIYFKIKLDFLNNHQLDISKSLFLPMISLSFGHPMISTLSHLFVADTYGLYHVVVPLFRVIQWFDFLHNFVYCMICFVHKLRNSLEKYFQDIHM